MYVLNCVQSSAVRHASTVVNASVSICADVRARTPDNSVKTVCRYLFPGDDAKLYKHIQKPADKVELQQALHIMIS